MEFVVSLNEDEKPHRRFRANTSPQFKSEVPSEMSLSPAIIGYPSQRNGGSKSKAKYQNKSKKSKQLQDGKAKRAAEGGGLALIDIPNGVTDLPLKSSIGNLLNPAAHGYKYSSSTVSSGKDHLHPGSIGNHNYSVSSYEHVISTYVCSLSFSFLSTFY